MLQLREVRDWILERCPELTGIISIGAIDANQPRYVGVYDTPSATASRLCIGGLANTKWHTRRVVILVHWTTSPVEAEREAYRIYRLFYGLAHETFGSTQVVMADPGGAPVSVGKDTMGICEYSIPIDLTYMESEE